MKHSAAPPLAFLLLTLAMACGDPPTTKLAPAIDVIASHKTVDGALLMDYGPVPVLHEKSLKLVVRNMGRASLVVHGIEMANDAEGVFTLAGEQNWPLQISGGQQEIVELRFKPRAELEYVGALVVSHDDPNNPPVEIGLKGTGSTVSRIELDPMALDFGRVGERAQASRTLEIRSVGSATLVVDSVELIDSPPEFSILGSSAGVSLPPPLDGLPGGSVKYLVACSPTEETEEVELEGTLLIRNTDPEQPELRVPLTCSVNRAPEAIIEELPPAVPAPGDPIDFDGSNSTDEDGDLPLTYAWTVYQKPFGSNAHFEDPTSPTPRLLTDVPGEYSIGLTVTDSAGLDCLHPGDNPNEPCAIKRVLVRSDDQLSFVLSWDHTVTDLDLHLVEKGGELFSEKDCYHANRRPDFGVLGDDTDDPLLVHDDLAGLGPESIVYTAPAEGEYELKVVFSKTNAAANPTSFAVVRIYVFGILEAEQKMTLDQVNQVWNVATISWPSREITVDGTVGMVDVGEETDQ